MTPENTGKKIAIIASSAPPIISGGISSAHYNLFKALKNKGFAARIFTYTDHRHGSEGEKDVTRHGTPWILLRLLNIVFFPYRYLLQRKEKSELAYQLYYVLESAVGSLRTNKSLREFAPDVVILPDNGSPGFFIKKTENCKFIFISHHNYLRFVNEPLIGIFSVTDAELAASFERKILNKVDKVICPSHYMQKVFQRTHEFGGPVAVIPNIVDIASLTAIPASDLRGKMGLSDEAPLVYIPAAGSPIKGSRYVFEIARRLTAAWGKEIGFYLSGCIDSEIQKRELSFVPPNAKIHMPGYTSYDENISLIKACSFCVSPTLLESFGMAILEANFCGLPVITFDVGGTADIIANGINGFLVTFMDIEGLISHSEQLLDAHYLKELRQKTINYVSDKFEQEKLLDRYIKYIF